MILQQFLVVQWLNNQMWLSVGLQIQFYYAYVELDSILGCSAPADQIFQLKFGLLPKFHKVAPFIQS